MRPHRAVVLAAAAALTVPVAATADIGPHTTWYAEHPNSQKPGNDVFIAIRRDNHKAYVTVTNYCLGTSSYKMSNGKTVRYPNSVNTPMFHAGKTTLSYRGKAMEYTARGDKTLQARFSARLSHRRYTGHVSFRGTKCGTIRFVSKFGGRSK